MLKKIIAVAGIAGTLGVAAPAFADWHGGYHGGGVVRGPVARPIYRPVARPYYGSGYGDGYRPEHRTGWEWRRYEWLRHHPRYYRGW